MIRTTAKTIPPDYETLTLKDGRIARDGIERATERKGVAFGCGRGTRHEVTEDGRGRRRRGRDLGWESRKRSDRRLKGRRRRAFRRSRRHGPAAVLAVGNRHGLRVGAVRTSGRHLGKLYSGIQVEVEGERWWRQETTRSAYPALRATYSLRARGVEAPTELTSNLTPTLHSATDTLQLGILAVARPGVLTVINYSHRGLFGLAQGHRSQHGLRQLYCGIGAPSPLIS